MDFVDLFIFPGYVTVPVWSLTYVVVLLVTRSTYNASKSADKACVSMVAVAWIATLVVVAIIIYGSLCYAVVDLLLKQFHADDKVVIVTAIIVTLITFTGVGYLMYRQERLFSGKRSEVSATPSNEGLTK